MCRAKDEDLSPRKAVVWNVKFNIVGSELG